MSGIEVAGLVLGALPLIVEVLKAYSSGASTIRRYIRYQRPLKSLSTELGIEYVLYQNACERLLDGLVDDNTEREALLQKPGGPAWKNQELERKLQKRLSKGYPFFVDTVKDIELAVSDLMKLLKFSLDGQPQFNAANGFEKEYQRLSFSLKKSKYDDLVSTVRKHGAALRELTNQSIVLEPRRSARRLPDFDLIRSYAASIYTTFCTALQCNCQTTHVLHLRLENLKNCCSILDLPCFRVVLQYSSSMTLHSQAPWRIEALDIRYNHGEAHRSALPEKPRMGKRGVRFSPAPSANPAQIAPVPTPLRVKQICGAIHGLKKTCMGDYIGFIEDEPNGRKLDLYQPRKTTQTQTQSSLQPALLSLHEALTRDTSRRRHFPKANGLRSAVLLSANLLQLYRTPWLTETWSHDDIAFFESADGGGLEEPFVSRPSLHQSNNGLADSGFSPWDGPVRNQSLFGLGVLLIELCLDAPFEELRRRRKKGQRDLAVSSDMTIANLLLEEVAEEFGPSYSSAVRRCIRCDFDTEKMDIEDVAFRKAVYEGVVIPLEDALKSFNGGAT
ncbi:hypothetical protein SLS58_008712 [Diplodia intermedia]|uniref:DUF7580 domain-containing protein n=1 Tax=Diplodia intermedia TaxID=856260 RepID=A0ABR3TGP2_9PEZI